MSCPTPNDSLARRAWLVAALCAAASVASEHAMAADEPRAALDVTIDLAKVNLERRQLELQLSRPAAKATLKVIGPEGKVLAEVVRHFQGVKARVPLVLQWPAYPPERIVRIEVFGYDTEGFFKGVAVTPWSAEVPHEEVLFASGSARIPPAEEGKLKRTRERVAQLLANSPAGGKVQLYIVAHTDTVGSAADNRRLSTRRAEAIARWFRGRGLKLPIVFAGLGEEALKVQTADNVDEASNRRVDYWLSMQPPQWGKKRVVVQWHRL